MSTRLMYLQWKRNVQDIEGEVLCGKPITSESSHFGPDKWSKCPNSHYRPRQRKGISRISMVQRGAIKPVSFMTAFILRSRSSTLLARSRMVSFRR